MANNESNVIRLDRYLTNFATTYKVEERVADFIAPPFKVQRPTDKFVQFTKNKLRVYDSLVGREEEAKQIEFEKTDGIYSCNEHSLRAFIANRDVENMDSGWRIDEIKTELVLDAIRLAREYRLAQMCTNTAIVTNYSTPSTKWDVSGGTPVANILTAMAAVKNASTKVPNRIVMTLDTALKLIQTTEWKDYFKFTTTGFPNLFNAIDGFRQLGLQPMIAGAFGVNTAKGTASDPGIEAILGKNALLFYGEDSPTTQSRTFMYSPFIYNEQIMRDIRIEKRGYYIQAESFITELMVDAQCGYLFTSVIS